MVIARPYRGVTAADRLARRRAQLLEATLDLWGDPQRPRVTMTGVCARANLTERYFYESFGHLDDALAAVLQQIADEIERTTVDALARAGGDPTDRVRASIGAYWLSSLSLCCRYCLMLQVSQAKPEQIAAGMKKR